VQPGAIRHMGRHTGRQKGPPREPWKQKPLAPCGGAVQPPALAHAIGSAPHRDPATAAPPSQSLVESELPLGDCAPWLAPIASRPWARLLHRALRSRLNIACPCSLTDPVATR
jgi:hypothetical protein